MNHITDYLSGICVVWYISFTNIYSTKCNKWANDRILYRIFYVDNISTFQLEQNWFVKLTQSGNIF